MAQAVQPVQHGPTAPGIAKGAAAGSGTLTLDAGSTDMVGSVASTPNADDTTGIIATITFAVPFRSAPKTVLLTAKGAGFATALAFVSSITATAFVVTGTVDPGGASLAFSYVVIPEDGA